MNTDKNALLKIIEHPVLLLKEEDIGNLKLEIQSASAEECKNLLEIFNEIIKERTKILEN